VLRAFGDPDVPGPSDPLDHLGVLEIELSLADLDSAEKQLDKRRRAAKGDPSAKDDVKLLEEALTHLTEGTPLYRSGMSADQLADLRPFFLLTNKPVMAVVNVGEDDLDSIDAVSATVSQALSGAEVLGMCVQLEAEAALMDVEERQELLDGLGLGEGALPRFSRAAYHLLGLRTYFTTGEKESRAWPGRSRPAPGRPSARA